MWIGPLQVAPSQQKEVNTTYFTVTHLFSMSYFYSSENIRKLQDFLMFSGVLTSLHLKQMV